MNNEERILGLLEQLTGDMSDMKGEMSQLRGEMSQVKGEISSLKAEVAELREDMNDGFDRLENLVNVAGKDIARVEKRVLEHLETPHIA